MDWKWSDGDIVTGIVRTGGVASRVVMPHSLLVGDMRRWVERRVADRLIAAMEAGRNGDAKADEDHTRVAACLMAWQQQYGVDDRKAASLAESEPLLAARMRLGVDEVHYGNMDDYAAAVERVAGEIADGCGLVSTEPCTFALIVEPEYAGIVVTRHLRQARHYRTLLPVYVVSEAELAETIAAWQ